MSGGGAVLLALKEATKQTRLAVEMSESHVQLVLPLLLVAAAP